MRRTTKGGRHLKTKLSNREIGLSIFVFTICYAVLVGVMFLMIEINEFDSPSGVAAFITDNFNNIITVMVAAAILSIVLYIYFLFENKTVLSRYRKIVEIYTLLCLALIFCDVIYKYIDINARPLMFFALTAAMILSRKDALFVNVVFMITMFTFNYCLNGPDEFNLSIAGLLTIFCGGAVGIIALKKVKTRIGCVMIALVLMLPTLVINLVMQLPSAGVIVWERVLDNLIYSAVNCVFSVFLFLFVLPVFEAVFSELTPFRLRELTSDHAKLMKLLKTNAIGTYNHSVVVAQLAEACASAIGEDSELARAAAYYHDVGKLKNPEMFTENQSDYDLHKELTPELSVDIIRSHARDGAKLIKKNRLPDFFADVAVQHHGTLPIKYFYAKALKMSDGELNIGKYSYSGPTPTSKIAAIIMIADAAEAATRSLSDRSPEKVQALVNGLVEERMNMDQFVDCDITMRDLTVITRTIVNSLTGVYHSRIAYPKLILSKKN